MVEWSVAITRVCWCDTDVPSLADNQSLIAPRPTRATKIQNKERSKIIRSDAVDGFGGEKLCSSV